MHISLLNYTNLHIVYKIYLYYAMCLYIVFYISLHFIINISILYISLYYIIHISILYYSYFYFILYISQFYTTVYCAYHSINYIVYIYSSSIYFLCSSGDCVFMFLHLEGHACTHLSANLAHVPIESNWKFLKKLNVEWHSSNTTPHPHP